MAAITAEELRILVRAETKQARDSLDRFRKSSKNTTIDLKQLAKQLIGPLSITAGLVMLSRTASRAISASVRYAASVEQMSISFEVLLGSAQAAQDVLDDLREFSIKTPFTFEELGPAAKRLIAFGTAADDVVDVMRDLGNASAGNRETLNRLVDAYGKVQAKGRASLEELNRFTEAGVPLMRQLGQDLGLTNEELFKFVSQGKVGFTEVNTALQNLTRGEGQFAGMLEAQSQTLEGAMSTLKGSVQELGNALAKDFLPWLTQVVQKITGLIDVFNKAKEAGSLAAEVFAEDFLDIGSDMSTRDIKAKFEAVNKLIENLTNERERLLERSASLRPGSFGYREAVLEYETIVNTLEMTQNRLIDLSEITSRMGIVLSDSAEATGKSIATGMEDGAEAMSEAMRNIMSPDTLQEFNARFYNPIVTYATQAGKDAAKNFAGVFKEGLPGTVAGGPEVFFDPIVNSVNKAKTEVDNFKASIEKISDVLTVSAGESLFDPIIQGADEAARAMLLFNDALKSTLAETTGMAALDLFRDMGEAMADSSEGAKSAQDAMQDFLTSVLNALPQLLFSAGLRALADPDIPWEVGVGLILASGVAAFFSGIAKGAVNTERANRSGGSDVPDSSTMRTGTAYAGSTVTVNYNGTVFADDEAQYNTAATMAAVGGNR